MADSSAPGWSAVTVLVGSLALALSSCAGDLVLFGAGEEAEFRHRGLGYRIDFPSFPPGEPWERVELKKTDLAFANGAGASMSLMSECSGSEASLSTRARNLFIGLVPRELRASAPIAVGGLSGWMQVIDTADEGVPVQIKSITLASGACTFDWILVSPGALGATEGAFDRWWMSFRSGQALEAARASEDETP